MKSRMTNTANFFPQFYDGAMLANLEANELLRSQEALLLLHMRQRLRAVLGPDRVSTLVAIHLPRLSGVKGLM